MAFTEPSDKDLIFLLQQGRNPQLEGNLLRRSTAGLKQLYTEISATTAFDGKISKSSGLQTDSNGFLNLGSSNPILLKQYELHEIIGEGTFSHIYRATDIYSFKDCAIKVMRAGFHVLGSREVAFLRHFNSKELKGTQRCKLLLVYLFIYISSSLID